MALMRRKKGRDGRSGGGWRATWGLLRRMTESDLLGTQEEAAVEPLLHSTRSLPNAQRATSLLATPPDCFAPFPAVDQLIVRSNHLQIQTGPSSSQRPEEESERQQPMHAAPQSQQLLLLLLVLLLVPTAQAFHLPRIARQLEQQQQQQQQQQQAQAQAQAQELQESMGDDATGRGLQLAERLPRRQRSIRGVRCVRWSARDDCAMPLCGLHTLFFPH